MKRQSASDDDDDDAPLSSLVNPVAAAAAASSADGGAGEGSAPGVKVTPFALHDAASAGDVGLLQALLAALDEGGDDEFVPADDRWALVCAYV
jgi:hypothetical protein